jgi:cell fate regulator YaaT (PSP1 superfamily)
MCCLRYEQESYEYEIARTPAVDTNVKTPDGVGTVIEISPLLGNVKVRLQDNPDVMPKTYKRDDVKVISRPAPAQEEK